MVHFLIAKHKMRGLLQQGYRALFHLLRGIRDGCSGSGSLIEQIGYAGQVASLKATFDPVLPKWQQAEQQRPYHADPSEVNATGGEIYYGLCAGNHFYLYSFDLSGQDQDYAYVPNGTPQNCKPRRLSVFSSQALGDGWYTVIAAGVDPNAITPTPTSVLPVTESP
jgi:hypothetical protein